MRTSPLKNRFAAAGAKFAERLGTEVTSYCSDKKQEYHFIRESVGLTDFSYMQKFRIPEETGLDFLDTLLAGNVAKIRFGRVLHTFLPDEQCNLVSDCYVANNDEEYVVLCESIAEDTSVRSIFTKDSTVGVEDLTESHAVFGIDGYRAWAVVKELFGTDVLGLPYLSIEHYEFEGSPVRLIRAGKTSEFGYLLLVPKEIAESLFDRLYTLVKEQNGGLCGVEIHNELRLEGRFFNIFAEGAKVKDPLALGLQYMIDFDKEEFTGRESIVERRKTGMHKKIIGISGGTGSTELKVGTSIFDGEQQVAIIEASCYSYVLESALGLALFNVDVAYSGLEFCLGKPGGSLVKTISMPPIMPKSLTVKLDDM